MEKLIGKILSGRYYVLEIIGYGGFSNVYKVKDIKTGTLFAMKSYFTSNPGDEIKILEGLERELNVLRYTSHPNLPKFLDLIKENNQYFLIMELYDGITLKQLVDHAGPLNKKDMKYIMHQVCSALYYLHSLEPPIIYRDLKPSNILLLENNKVKLIDFGIAKRYSRERFAGEQSLGSKGFAAPEQYGDANGYSLYNTDIRTDVYGIGTTMYYLSTREKYEPNHITLRWGRKVSKVISKCTKINPKDRYQNVLEVLIDLGKI